MFPITATLRPAKTEFGNLALARIKHEPGQPRLPASPAVRALLEKRLHRPLKILAHVA